MYVHTFYRQGKWNMVIKDLVIKLRNNVEAKFN